MKYFGCIYKITNNINGKCYIGQTTQKDPYRRIRWHFKTHKRNFYIGNAIKKYGKENFKVEIIASSFDQDGLNETERYIIKYYNSYGSGGYNETPGGENGYTMSPKQKEKISIKVKEYYKHNVHPNKDKKFTKEHCDNMSKVRKGFTSSARIKANKKAIKKLMKRIEAKNILTEEILIFESIEECAKKLNLIGTCISRVCRGKQGRTQHKGWKFRFLDDKRYTPLEPKSKEMLYINKQNNKFIVNDRKVYCGIFDSLEEAKYIRDILINNPEEALKKSIELSESKNKPIWKKRKKILNKD